MSGGSPTGAAERITGYRAEEVVGFACAEGILVHVDARGNHLCQQGCPLAATMADGVAHEATVYLHHKEGHRVPGLVQDSLTGLGNRRFLDLKLELCRIESQITGRPFGVLMVDVDRFKDINDSFGHGVGDRALRMTAETLRNGIRRSDYLGRWGGDEFLVMLTGLSQAMLAELGEKMRVLVERSTLEADGRMVGVTVSIGATMSRLKETHVDLLERVDGLLYQAKDHGRNAVHLAV